MSFKCGFCRKSQEANVAVKTVIVERRERSYRNMIPVENKETGKVTFVPKMSEGWEIVKEVAACGECAEKHTPKQEVSTVS